MVCFLVEFNYYRYKHSLTERWLSGWKHRSWKPKDWVCTLDLD